MRLTREKNFFPFYLTNPVAVPAVFATGISATTFSFGLLEILIEISRLSVLSTSLDPKLSSDAPIIKILS
jgi:hypothetical protein